MHAQQEQRTRRLRGVHNVCTKICFVPFSTVMEGKIGVQGHQGGLETAPKPWHQAANVWAEEPTLYTQSNRDTSSSSIKLDGTAWVIGFSMTNLRSSIGLEFHGWFIARFTKTTKILEKKIRRIPKDVTQVLAEETFRINQIKTKSDSTSFVSQIHRSVEPWKNLRARKNGPERRCQPVNPRFRSLFMALHERNYFDRNRNAYEPDNL